MNEEKASEQSSQNARMGLRALIEGSIGLLAIVPLFLIDFENRRESAVFLHMGGCLCLLWAVSHLSTGNHPLRIVGSYIDRKRQPRAFWSLVSGELALAACLLVAALLRWSY